VTGDGGTGRAGDSMVAHGEEEVARLELSLVAEPGDPRIGALVQALGAVEARRTVRAGLPLLGDTGERWRHRLSDAAPRRAQTLLERSATAVGEPLRWVCPGAPEWPAHLEDLAHAEPLQRLGGVPLGLWVRGPLDLATTVRQAVSVVGSRAATSYGVQVAGDIAAWAADRGCAVVSGAALGIDVAAHRGALAVRGPTVAVLACGVDVAYPRAHDALLRRIAADGLVVSELCPGSTPSKVRFLARNRLIAALSAGTVLVEAAHRSGALNTLNWAARLGRTTMGVPGPVTSSASSGVHQLIRDGGAQLVTGGDEVLELVAQVGEHTTTAERGPETLMDLLPERAGSVLETLQPRRAWGVSTIASRAGLSVPEVMRELAALQAAGHAESTADGWRLTRATAAALRHPAGAAGLG
jgi:DNA processing protein